MDERERERLRAVEASRRAQEPVVAGLAAAGFVVESIPDLYNGKMDYRGAIPTLIEWLPRVDDPGVKMAIARALSVRWAKPAATRPLLDELRRPRTSDQVRWTVANALSIVVGDAEYGDIVAAVRDRGLGKAREMLAIGLGNMRNPEAVDVLIELLEDDEVAGHAIMALGKLKAARARGAVERFLDHPRAWIRKEARKALERIDKAEKR